MANVGSQYGLSIGVEPVSLTVPTSAIRAELYVRAGAIVYKRDGSDPTTYEGFVAEAGATLVLHGKNDMTNFRAIPETGSPRLDIEYFSGLVQ